MKVLVVFGTRPEGIKMAPVIQAIERDPDLELVTVSTGQHREMLQPVLDMFSLSVDVDLNIMKPNQSLSEITTGVIQGMSSIIEQTKPNIILVHGDTTTSFAAAMAAYYHKISVGHVEAGLRTREKYSPFPEELNRQLTARIADIHFSPTDFAKQNLLEEGISDNQIVVTGNTSIDTLHYILDKDKHSKAVEELVNLVGEDYLLMTIHRRENISSIKDIFSAIGDIAMEYRKHIIYPVHLNPFVKATAEEVFSSNPFIHLIAPQDINNFLYLMKHSLYVITDSGGIQEEAPSLNKPVFVVRDTTERQEGQKVGTLKLIGTTYLSVYDHLSQTFEDLQLLTDMASKKNPYGDGHAANRIVSILKNYLQIK
jgi:UDP-N-acetylglucosamine 2-epimerase